MPLTGELSIARMLRDWRRHPVSASIATLSLAIGVASLTTIISVRDIGKGNSSPFPNAGRVVALHVRGGGEARQYLTVTSALLERAALRTHQLLAVAPIESNEVFVQARAWTDRVPAVTAPASFSQVLGIHAAVGRTFTEADELPGAVRVVVLSHRFWESHFRSDSTLVGRAISVNGVLHVVVGVLPESARFPDRKALWLLRSVPQAVADTAGRYTVFGLLAPGATPDAVDATLSGLTVDVPTRGSGRPQHRSLGAVPFRTYLADRMGNGLPALTMVAVVVALIAGVNFAAIVLAQGIGRRNELGVRALLGATSGRLARQLLFECLTLSVPGGLMGAVAAPMVLRAVVASGAGLLPEWAHPTLTAWTTLAGVAVAVLLGVCFGIPPAVELARPAASALLHGTGQVMSAPPRQLAGWRALVVAQVGLSTGPIVLAAALAGDFLSFKAVDPGFNEQGLYVADVRANDSTLGVGPPELQRDGVGSTHAAVSHGDSRLVDARRSMLLTILRQTSGVTSASLAHAEFADIASVQVLGDSTGNGKRVAGGGSLEWQRVSTQYFATVRPVLVAGRLPDEGEIARGEPVAVVTQSLARRLRGAPAVGWQLAVPGAEPGGPVTVVGIIRDVHSYGTVAPPIPRMYTPIGIAASSTPVSDAVFIRGQRQTPDLADSINARVGRDLPGVVLVGLERSVDRSQREWRPFRAMKAIAIFVFGLALALAALGMYGMIAHTSAVRRKELAIRAALGGSRAHLAGIVVGAATTQVALGLVSGIVFGTLAARMFAGSASSGLPPGGTVATLTIAVTAALAGAALIPIRRAWGLNTARALRDEP